MVSGNPKDEEILPLSALTQHVTSSMTESSLRGGMAGLFSSNPLIPDKSASVRSGGETADAADVRASDNPPSQTNPVGVAGEPQSWKGKLIMVDRSGSVKDKKSRDKDNRTCRNRLERFLEEVVGASVSTGKHISVVAADLPFRRLRDLGSIVCDMTSESPAFRSASDELHRYLESDPSQRRVVRAVLSQLSDGIISDDLTSSSTTVVYVYLYSSIEDRFDMISYVPSLLSKAFQALSASSRTNMTQMSPSRPAPSGKVGGGNRLSKK